MVTDQLTLNIKAVDNATKVVDNVNKKLDKTGGFLDTIRGKIITVGMGFLFGGMAINRFFATALRGIWNTYKEIIDVNDQFFQATQRLHAAWEFFKFSLIDALSQSPLFMRMVEYLIILVNQFGQLDPETKAFIVTLLLLGFVASFVMSKLGQLALILYSVSVAAAFFGISITLATAAWILGIILLIAIIIIFRKRLWAMLQFIWHGLIWISAKWQGAWLDMITWAVDKIAAFINWAISQLNRIPGINIEWRMETPEFLTRAREHLAGIEAQEGAAAMEALTRAEEAYGPEDMIKGVMDMLNELKELKEEMKKVADNTDGAVVIPSSMQ